VIRTLKVENINLKQQVEQLEQKVGFTQRALDETTIKRHAIVYIDPRVHGAYDQPSPNTDPELQRRLEARRQQQALQDEILAEQKRQARMKKFVAEITGKPDVRTAELPSVTGELRRMYTTKKLKPITLEPTRKVSGM
jgi:hypothetical protein